MLHDNDFIYFKKQKCFRKQKDTDATENNKCSEKKWFEKKYIVRNQFSCYDFSNICQYRCEKYCVMCR